MSLVRLAVRRPVTISMFTLAVLLFGMVSLGRIPVTLLPDLAYPTLTVRTDYPGGAPGEVEQLVSKPIEENLGTVKGIRRIESVSRAGQSDVMLEFAWGTNMDMASLDVREKLDLVELPLDIDKPILLRFNPSEEPVFRMALAIESESAIDPLTGAASISELKRLRTYAEEELKRQLESVDGVASVRLGGGLEDEIQVLVDEQRASQLQVPMSLIMDRLREENINLSGGRLESDRSEYLVRTLNQFQDLDDIRAIYIATRNERPVLLRDLAEVKNSYKERDSISRVAGMEAVEVSLYKEGDANTIRVSDEIKAHLQYMQNNKMVPEDYTIRPVYDQAVFISAAIDEVRDSAIIGGLLAMVIIYLFLQRVWPTVIISLAIPISIIATFNLMHGYQVSLNMMSLGGIALAVGMLVDNAIVVLENIARHGETQSADVAAERGTSEVASAITASTLTTMAVFFPLVFVEGIAGQLFRDQALTVTFSLAASLLVALTLIPMLSTRSKQRQDDADPVSPPRSPAATSGWRFWLSTPLLLVFRWIPMAVIMLLTLIWRLLARGFFFLVRPLLAGFNWGYTRLANSYRRVLEKALAHAKVTLAAIVLVAAGCYALLPMLPVSLLPDMAQGEFYVEVELQPGATIYETDTVLAGLGNVIASNDQLQRHVSRYYSVAGTGSLLNAAPGQSGNQWGRLNVVMQSGGDAEAEAQVQQALRDYTRTLPGVMVKFGRPELFSFSSPITIELNGYDLTLLQSAAEQVARQLEGAERFTDIRVNMTDGQPELAVIFDHAKLSQYGLTSADVSELLATKIGGRVATQFSLADRKIDILVRSQAEDRDSLRDLRQMIINPGADREIPLQSIATITPIIGPSEITRVDQQRTALVEANLAFGDLGAAVTEARDILAGTELPLTINAQVAGQNEEMQSSFRSLQFALVLAVFLVYLVMASQFESLLHPFFILLSVPLAGAGSVLGLFLLGTELSIIVFIGLIMLAGIVVNNAIVLVDRINQLRREGADRFTAVFDAAQHRLRPILMTMLTTVLGLLPLAIGLGEGAEIRAPMAISVIAGLLFSTLLTLFFIPCLYLLVDRKTVKTPEAAL
ncbi:acriflavin resistance protein [Pseudidiomarina salinarum]|uniref:Acriflavin resistance protein n=1 Tax=Pseudidiomarina salinarum TaxID=435908 RepID=A0A094JHQ7_9GAMM|nr:efflux RND transporter permease subunit [Pseudidiomarina salinarum]KFZ32081.1 acriflavin resistance protein [Pseudidiomarina salinarum]RUO70140.1 AcrB/AcrD/AcrF family protein [Pseudidiomarina salinarum]